MPAKSRWDLIQCLKGETYICGKTISKLMSTFILFICSNLHMRFVSSFPPWLRSPSLLCIDSSTPSSSTTQVSAPSASMGCPTHYQTRHFFNNSNTNEDIATKQAHITDTFLFISHTMNVLLFKFHCNIFIVVN